MPDRGISYYDALGFYLPPVCGSKFFLNGVSGDNDNDGLTPATPKLTMTAALGLCTDDAGDVIYALDYYQPSGETWPISVNKSLVTILGYQNAIGGMFAGFIPWNVMVATGNYPVFDVVANNVLISGFQLYAGTASYACVTMDEGVGNVRIDRCRFNRGTYGVHLTAGDTATGIAVTNCFFQQGLASGGIYFDDDPAHCYIAGNYFNRLAGIAIRIGSGSGTVIENNHIALGSNTNGYAITLESGVLRAYVNNNYAAYGVECGTTFPYKDNGTVNDNNWGLNYFGKNAVVLS